MDRNSKRLFCACTLNHAPQDHPDRILRWTRSARCGAARRRRSHLGIAR